MVRSIDRIFVAAKIHGLAMSIHIPRLCLKETELARCCCPHIETRCMRFKKKRTEIAEYFLILIPITGSAAVQNLRCKIDIVECDMKMVRDSGDP